MKLLQNGFSGTPLRKKITATLLLVLFFNVFLFHEWGPISFVLATIGLFIFLLVSFDKKNLSKTLLISSGVLLLSSYFMIQRAYWFVQFLQGILILTTLGITLYLLATKIPYMRSLLELILAPVHLGLSYLKFIPITIQQVTSSRGKNQSKGRSIFVSLGIVVAIAIPILVILISLFSNADPIYSTFIKNVFGTKFLERGIQHILFSIILFSIFLPITMIRRTSQFESPLRFLNTLNLTREITIVMVLVAIVLASFLVVEWPYVFARVAYETDLSQFGIKTYSEYVRRGFIELLFVAFFIYSVSWLGLTFFRNTKNSRTFLRTVQIIVLSELLVFIASIFQRIWLYQAYHGLSLVRIYGGIFLVWITGITLFLIARHFWQKKYVIAEIAFTGILLLFLGFFNAEQFITATHPPTVNKRIDYVYLSSMSPDGYDGWIKSYDFAKQVVTTNNYKEKDLITKDERRQIAYAGRILVNLTYNYEKLLIRFGEDSELRDYYKNVFEFQKNAICDKITRFPPIVIQSQSLTNGPITTYIPNCNEFKVSQQNEDPVKEYQKINSILSQINKKNSDLKEIIFSNYPFLADMNTFNTDLNRILSFYYIHDISSAVSDTAYRGFEIRKSKINKLFTWNYAEYHVYQNIKNEINHQTLLPLHKAYFILFEKIANQPEKEREYDFDISFDTPLL